MAALALTEGTAHGPDFQQKDASAWISFDPSLTGHRKDVRSAAAKSSAAARKATIAKKLALSTDCISSPAEQAPRCSKKRRREQCNASPTSISSSATLHSRCQSEISLASLASRTSPISSAANSPCYMQAPYLPTPSSWVLDGSPLTQTNTAPLPSMENSVQRAVFFVMGIETSLGDPSIKEPTHFGASRVKSRAISTVHDAIGMRQTGSGTLLAVILLAAWDMKFGDERSSSLHLSAWHQLAFSQKLLSPHNGVTPTRLTLIDAIKLSLQWHLPSDAFTSIMTMLEPVPHHFVLGQRPSGRDLVCFFEIIDQLVAPATTP